MARAGCSGDDCAINPVDEGVMGAKSTLWRLFSAMSPEGYVTNIRGVLSDGRLIMSLFGHDILSVILWDLTSMPIVIGDSSSVTSNLSDVG